ncbi:hypothetical protein PR048_027252 [Dryococelus australis]|uniref:Uncharacterized protein n=1 Tax=Dryococelus australis TaxID=614101 RepID=A0ABQ9GEX4_9NEOP|nr:hypothetical protein PR048_027252 [Dryococelus australis]
MLTNEEGLCEHHFSVSHERGANDRYMVWLPFRDNNLELGESHVNVVARLHKIECQLKHQPDKHQKYVDFMNEYMALGHMELIPPEQLQKPPHETCYILHIPVLKESSATTKLRVVFDALTKTASGISLNDKMLVGVKLQEDFWSLLT